MTPERLELSYIMDKLIDARRKTDTTLTDFLDNYSADGIGWYAERDARDACRAALDLIGPPQNQAHLIVTDDDDANPARKERA